MHPTPMCWCSALASILATATLSDLGVPDIWAKAQTSQHASILERVGAHHVIFPERDMGRRVAHRVTGKMLEYVQFDDTNFAYLCDAAMREEMRARGDA